MLAREHIRGGGHRVSHARTHQHDIGGIVVHVHGDGAGVRAPKAARRARALSRGLARPHRRCARATGTARVRRHAAAAGSHVEPKPSSAYSGLRAGALASECAQRVQQGADDGGVLVRDAARATPRRAAASRGLAQPKIACERPVVQNLPRARQHEHAVHRGGT